MELQLVLIAGMHVLLPVRAFQRDMPVLAILRRKLVNRLLRQPMHPGFQLHAFWTLALLAEGISNRLPHHIFHRDLAGLEMPLALAVVDLSLDEALQARQIDVDIAGDIDY